MWHGWVADAQLDTKPLTAGRRLSLVYRLMWLPSGGHVPRAADFRAAVDRVSAAVGLWVQDPAGPSKLLYARPWVDLYTGCACS